MPILSTEGRDSWKPPWLVGFIHIFFYVWTEKKIMYQRYTPCWRVRGWCDAVFPIVTSKSKCHKKARIAGDIRLCNRKWKLHGRSQCIVIYEEEICTYDNFSPFVIFMIVWLSSVLEIQAGTSSFIVQESTSLIYNLRRQIMIVWLFANQKFGSLCWLWSMSIKWWKFLFVCFHAINSLIW